MHIMYHPRSKTSIILIMLYMLFATSLARPNSFGEGGGEKKEANPDKISSPSVPTGNSPGSEENPTGSVGSAHGPNWDSGWGWGSGPRSGWGYGYGSGHSPTGFGKGYGFGYGSGSGSGSGFGYGSGGGGASGFGYGVGGGAHGGSGGGGGGGGGIGSPSNHG